MENPEQRDQINPLYLFICSLILATIEICISIPILVVSHDKECDSKLHLWLTVRICRHSVRTPLDFLYVISFKLIVFRLRLIDSWQAEKIAHIYLDKGSLPMKIQKFTFSKVVNPNTYTGNFLLCIRQYYYHDEDTERSRKVEKLSKASAGISFVWMIIGVSWFFSSRTCSSSAPELYYWVLVHVILFFIIIGAPVLIAVLFCLCGPCLVFLMNRLNLQQNPWIRQALTQVTDSSSNYVAPATTAEIESLPSRTVVATESSSCAVCFEQFLVCRFLVHLPILVVIDFLNVFQENDKVRMLPCMHMFHEDCVCVRKLT